MLTFIDRWYNKIKPFLFKYKDGFFELPYLGNSPLLIIDSFRKMPFIKHDEKKQMITSTSPFVYANVYYQEFEDQLIILFSMLEIKANICFKGVSKKDLSHDYYCLTMSTNLEKDVVAKRIINGERIENSSFQLIKPGISLNTYHFKNSNFQSFSIYFKEEWLLKFITSGKDINNKLQEFKNSNTECYITTIDDDIFLAEFLGIVKFQLKIKLENRDVELLHTKVNDFLNYYLNTAFTLPNSSMHYNLSNTDRVKLKEVERILTEHITQKFPGISFIAKQIGFSETKLKSLFKEVYQKTLLEYFQDMQMRCAYDMLKEGKMKVTEVANHFGYANVGKFGATFKSYTNVLPSKVHSTENEVDLTNN